MVTFKECIDVFSFAFLLTSPLTSYGDQIFSMHRRKSSAGFSIDVCGIMLIARYSSPGPVSLGSVDDRWPAHCIFWWIMLMGSILRVFFWFGDRYALSL